MHDQLKNFETERNGRENDLKASYEKQINALKTEALSKESRLMENYDYEKKSLEARFMDKERSLMDKLNKLEELCRDLTEKKNELESQLKDATSRLRMVDRDYSSNQRDLEKIKDENRELVKNKYELEKENAALKVNLC